LLRWHHTPSFFTKNLQVSTFLPQLVPLSFHSWCGATVEGEDSVASKGIPHEQHVSKMQAYTWVHPPPNSTALTPFSPSLVWCPHNVCPRTVWPWNSHAGFILPCIWSTPVTGDDKYTHWHYSQATLWNIIPLPSYQPIHRWTLTEEPYTMCCSFYPSWQSPPPGCLINCYLETSGPVDLFICFQIRCLSCLPPLTDATWRFMGIQGCCWSCVYSQFHVTCIMIFLANHMQWAE